jgi:16S rRNA (guanine1516-N2)-methyltransferase
MSLPFYIDKEIYKDHLVNDLNVPASSIVNIYPKKAPFFLYKENGLHFALNISDNKFIHIDFLKGQMGWRLKRSEHETLIKKALGKKSSNLKIFDGTAGFLSDTLIFLALGHKVIACEQSYVMFMLLNDAIYRAKEELNFLENLNLVHGNAVDLYNNTENIDLIYLDPMYPINKKNSLRSGNMNDIKNILKIEMIKDLEDQIFFDLKKQQYKKIVLKRPIKSKIIDNNLNYQVKGKSTRFDVYI